MPEMTGPCSQFSTDGVVLRFLSLSLFLSLPFPSFPLHPHRPHTTVQISSLPHAVKQLNENPSIEDAFGKNIRQEHK